MELLVQWTRSTPRDYELVESWADLPKKPEPIGGETVGLTPGWVYGLTAQGIYFRGFDHYSVERVSAGEIVVTTWSDDPTDSPPGEKFARVTRFKPLVRDASGLYNTRIAIDVFAQSKARARFDAAASVEVTIHPWRLFTPPAEADTRHGIWIDQALADAHDAFLGKIGWGRYTTNVPAEDVVGVPPDDTVIRGR